MTPTEARLTRLTIAVDAMLTIMDRLVAEAESHKWIDTKKSDFMRLKLWELQRSLADEKRIAKKQKA